MRGTSLESIPSSGHVAGSTGSPTSALVLATISFALSFAAWGLVGGLASVFTSLYGLSASQTALLVAVLRSTLVARFLTVTVAVGMSAPEGSVTVPLIVAVAI